MKETVRLEVIKVNMSKYDDIIHLPHHVSNKHPRMSIKARSAQFAPFSALTGYEDEVKETARLTNERLDLDAETKANLDIKIQIILEHIIARPTVSITYFIPDTKKDGGKYVTAVGNIKKVDKYKQVIILEDKTEIPISEIISIDSSILSKLED